MKRILRTLPALIGLACGAPIMAHEGVMVRQSGSLATIENSRVRAEYDLAKGTYRAIDKADGRNGFSSAFTQVEGSRASEPTLLLEITLYDREGFLVLAAGIENTSGKPLRVREFYPLAGGHAFPQVGEMGEPKTVNGESGGRDTSVRSGPFRSSANNLLLTFRDGGRRRSLVLGGLTYHEFRKSVGTSPTPAVASVSSNRINELTAKAASAGGAMAAYFDCGSEEPPVATGGVRLRALRGKTWDYGSSTADPWFNTILFDQKQVVFEAAGLDPRKSYTLGFSWWDYNNDGRTESVYLVAGNGLMKTPLLEKALLPAYAGRQQMPEERAFAVPKSAYPSGKMNVVFALDRAKPGSNAVASELWLWEGLPDLAAKVAAPAPPAAAKADGKAVFLHLKAADPVGRLIDVGERWVPDDRFYVDFSSGNPFEALEKYGAAVRTAQHARPTPYDFPTLCSWWAGVCGYPGAQDHPEKSKYGIATTKGQVEELDHINRTGFTRYSRIALRLVPDNYTPNNPQGWWDDEHWRQQGFYVAPYETSRKWGHALEDRGGLAITYFQLNQLSADFRQAFPHLLLSGKGVLDYSRPETQAHLRRVYAAMRGNVAGMMFDHCDELWAGSLARGKFADGRTTAIAVYRKVFELAKEGLGPTSWVHERAIENPGSDITAGTVDSQRTSWDTKEITPELVSRSGLRWYKNRVLFAYDMDGKNLLGGWKRPTFKGTDRDGRRMTLTMCYVAGSRLLLANSFRDLPPEAVYDLERTVPYHVTTQSARPADAFVVSGLPRVYDFAVNADWHQVTLFNTDAAKETEITAPLGGDVASGGLGLDPRADYYVYDFWNDAFAGRLQGTESLKQTLRAGEARMLSVHRVESQPQFLSTNRHIMQGYLDLVNLPQWNPGQLELTGSSKVVGGEVYRVILALNGYRFLSAQADRGTAKIEPLPADVRLAALSINSPENAEIRWKVSFARP